MRALLTIAILLVAFAGQAQDTTRHYKYREDSLAHVFLDSAQGFARGNKPHHKFLLSEHEANRRRGAWLQEHIWDSTQNAKRHDH